MDRSRSLKSQSRLAWLLAFCRSSCLSRAACERHCIGRAAPLRDAALLALRALAFLGLFGEGVMADRGALLLERTTGAGQAAAALGCAAFSVAMMLGHFSGDWVVSRLGRRPALRLSGLAAFGVAIALGAEAVERSR